jgi:hypothetical protein
MVNNIVTTGKSDKNALSQDIVCHYPSAQVFLGMMLPLQRLWGMTTALSAWPLL